MTSFDKLLHSLGKAKVMRELDAKRLNILDYLDKDFFTALIDCKNDGYNMEDVYLVIAHFFMMIAYDDLADSFYGG